MKHFNYASALIKKLKISLCYLVRILVQNCSGLWDPLQRGLLQVCSVVPKSTLSVNGSILS